MCMLCALGVGLLAGRGEQILGNQNFRGGVTGRKGGANTR